jgi:hypothetical protein
MSQGMIFALATVCVALVALVVLAFFLGTEALSAIALILLAVLVIANWIANI